MRIPKVIHYCWFGGNEIPEHDRKCIESWKKFCPDYEIIQWNEENYDLNKAPLYVRQAYEAKKWAFVTDYVRLEVVYDHGGIYMDTDVELLKNLDSLLDCNAYFGFEDGRNIATGLGFGAAQRCPVLKDMMADYEDIPFVRPDGSMDMKPCPQRNTEVLLRRGLQQDDSRQVLDGGILILPTAYMCPMSYADGKIRLGKNAYSIHHYHDSWKTAEEKCRIAEYKKYVKVFGEKNGERIFRFLNETKNGNIRSAIRKMWKYMGRG